MCSGQPKRIERQQQLVIQAKLVIEDESNRYELRALASAF
jgi:hypothetical protein